MTTAVTPQLKENFEAATIPAWGLGYVGPGVTIGDPRFGMQGAHLDYQAGDTSARWSTSQLTATVDCHRFILGVWLRFTVAPEWFDTTAPNVIVVDDLAGTDLIDVRMTPSDGGMALVSLGIEEPLDAPVVDDWELWELRGTIDGTWRFDLRRAGVDVASIQALYYTSPIRLASVGIGDSIVGTGFNVVELDADRMWFWAGGETDPDPEWWSETDGVDGTPIPLVVVSAVLGPEPFTGYVGPMLPPGSFEREFVVHIIAGEDSTVTATVEANVDLDAQVIEFGLVPRGGNPLLFEAAAWIGDVGTKRAAEWEVGPSFTTEPTPNVYELWGMIDSGTPFLVDGEVICT